MGARVETLVHTVDAALTPMPERPGLRAFLIAIGAGSLLLATISQRFIERPTLAFKRHFPLHPTTHELEQDAGR